MKHTLKVLAAPLLALMLAFWAPAVSWALSEVPKEETVYALLLGDGTVDALYVVNAFELDAPGAVTDYGTYDFIRNLTTTDAIDSRDGVITAQAPAGWFCYEGLMTGRELPWDIAIDYTLDGEALRSGDLAGRSGQLVMDISVKPRNREDAAFTGHYMVQTTLTLSTERATGITAPGAAVTTAGDDKKLVFTLMPGREGSYRVEARVTDFEMEPIQFAAIAMSMNIEIDDRGQLIDGVTELTGGVGDLSDAAAQLTEGSGEYQKAVDELASQAGQLQSGSSAVSSGLAQLNQGLSALAGSPELPDGLAALQQGSSQYQAGLDEFAARTDGLAGGSAQFAAGLQGAAQGAGDAAAAGQSLVALAQSLAASP